MSGSDAHHRAPPHRGMYVSAPLDVLGYVRRPFAGGAGLVASTSEGHGSQMCGLRGGRIRVVTGLGPNLTR